MHDMNIFMIDHNEFLAYTYINGKSVIAIFMYYLRFFVNIYLYIIYMIHIMGQ